MPDETTTQDTTTQDDTTTTQDDTTTTTTTTDDEPELGTTSEDTTEDTTDDELNPDDAKLIKKTIQKEIAPIQDTLQKQAIEGELQAVLTQNPEYKDYEKEIRKYVTHPNRLKFIKQGLPVKTVVAEAIEPHLQEIGAKKKEIADAKAAATSNGTNAAAPAETQAPDFGKMSNKDVTDMAEKIKSGQFKAKK